MGLLFGKKEKSAWQGKRKGKILTVQLSEELYTRLDTISKRYGISKSQIIRDALIEKLNRLEKENV